MLYFFYDVWCSGISSLVCYFFCFKQKTAYELRISDWSSDGALPISGPRHDAQGDQALHPLHRRLAPRAARVPADLHDRRTPPPLARPAAERRRACELLRNPRHRIFQGRDARRLEQRVDQLRQPQEGRSEEQTSELQSLMRNSYAVLCL